MQTIPIRSRRDWKTLKRFPSIITCLSIRRYMCSRRRGCQLEKEPTQRLGIRPSIWAQPTAYGISTRTNSMILWKRSVRILQMESSICRLCGRSILGREGSFIIRVDIPSATLWKNRIWKLQDARCSGRQNSDEVKRNEKGKGWCCRLRQYQ